MRKSTLVKLLCLALVCMLLIPMVIACGDDEEEGTGSTSSTPASNNGGDNSATTEKVTIVFKGNAQGVVFEGEKSVEIAKGSKLSEADVPEVFLTGYDFVYWAYDKNGDEEWNEAEKFNEDDVLYAIWAPKSNDNASSGNNGGTSSSDNGTNSSVPGTDSSVPGTDSSVPGTDSSVPGTDSTAPGTDSSNPPVVTPPADDMITIEFNTGIGYFEDDSQYEIEIKKGGRLSTLPTPVHENPAMLFEGWYKDSSYAVAVSRSDKYEESVMLYAYWIEQAECTDGSYDHLYSTWDTDTQPDCTRPGTVARFCSYCNDKQVKQGDPAKGHLWGQWQEAFMARERTCGRLGCGEKEIQNFADVTMTVLGNKPADQIEGNSDAFYDVPFTALINGTWNEGSGHFVGPRGNGAAYVIFTFIEPTAIDRIYFKGDGSVSMNILVQYEGEDDFTFIGLCAGAADKENTPFKEPDPTKKIVKVKFQEDNPPKGTSMWQEVAFVKVATNEE